MAYDYDLIVMGGGATGLTGSGVGVTLGAKTLMIERRRLGGDCTWTGCVPSKVLLKAAKVAYHIRCASQFGLSDQPLKVDFGRVMSHLKERRREVYEDADRPEIYEDMGVEVRFGEARFADAHTIEIEHDGIVDRVTGRYILIGAGARAFVPPIKGIEGVPYLTNETLFELDELPPRLAIVGGGPIGTEMAQAFHRLGSEVTVLDMLPRILANDDEELAAIMQATLEREGVRYVLGAGVKGVRTTVDGIALEAEKDGEVRVIKSDALLMATGRRANLDGLNLEAAGVAYTRAGITVDDHCRTNRRHIFAAGDVTGRYQFTHMSEHMAKIAVTNALLKVPMKIDTKHVPWATFTDPELAHVGATEKQLKEAGTSYQVFRFPFSRIDRALTDSETTGWIKVFAKKSGKILGATILGASAGEMISEYALAMRNGITLRKISDTIHPYPSYGLGVRRAADQWYVSKQSPTLTRMLQKVFGYRGPVLEFEPGQIV